MGKRYDWDGALNSLWRRVGLVIEDQGGGGARQAESSPWWSWCVVRRYKQDGGWRAVILITYRRSFTPSLLAVYEFPFDRAGSGRVIPVTLGHARSTSVFLSQRIIE